MGEQKKCQWRDCDEIGHGHDYSTVTFKAFHDAKLAGGGIYLCKTHCKQAKQTGHMDILISAIHMGTCNT